jgi:hypothetical protein
MQAVGEIFALVGTSFLRHFAGHSFSKVTCLAVVELAVPTVLEADDFALRASKVATTGLRCVRVISVKFSLTRWLVANV